MRRMTTEKEQMGMSQATRELIEKLDRDHWLSDEELLALVKAGPAGSAAAETAAKAAADVSRVAEDDSKAAAALLEEKADRLRRTIYGNQVYVRGLIEMTNYCKNDCYYCGIRRSNRDCDRYRLTEEQILACCREGYELGFRTFVLQGGEDAWFTDERLEALIGEIKKGFPDCAVTLSLGERSPESFERLRQAGADRYLLRHETATKSHYETLHPETMSFENRMSCLRILRSLGYQVGCGFMVGSPGQRAEHLAADLAFIRDFQPDMCGIGPFIPHHATPLGGEPAGTLEQTVYLLSIIRLLVPGVLLPATTALGTIDPVGREKGILAGANVVMPNLSPVAVRKKYELYENKICTGEESAQCRGCLAERMASIGFEIVTDRGDVKRTQAACRKQTVGK